VDTQQCDTPWAIEVDWGAIYVRPSLNYALFFVHGWTGEPSGFEVFQSLAQQGDYLAYASQNLERGVLPLDESAQVLKQEILDTTTYSGTDKVFVVAHSRGGLFTRAALRAYPELQSKVAGYVTLSTPHHGADEPDNLLSDDWPLFPFLQDYRNQCRKVSDQEACNRAAQSMRIEGMMKFNYGADCHIQEIQDQYLRQSRRA
jgi:pimeloyl-ACP methyl ester carboxylesterase